MLLWCDWLAAGCFVFGGEQCMRVGLSGHHVEIGRLAAATGGSGGKWVLGVGERGTFRVGDGTRQVLETWNII